MRWSELLLAGSPREQLEAYFEPRAAAIDAGQLDLREGLRWLNEGVLAAAAGEAGPNHDLTLVCRTIATVAWSDLATAFSLWCHRMVLEYLAQALAGSSLCELVLPRLLRTEVVGSTALASGMSHAVLGTPLPVQATRATDQVCLTGTVPWASNLFTPDFVLVLAAATSAGPIIVTVPGEHAGVAVAPPARLLALDGTRSSSIRLTDVVLPADWVLTDDFTEFIRRVRPVFLLLQSSFALGLAARALAEAAPGVHGANAVLQPDLAALEATAHLLVATLLAAARQRGQSCPLPELVRLRYESACLAVQAVALEAKTQGGRGYLASSATARRLREAAFLPIQSPTEGQLRWELQHCA
ncbi:MAG: acyl-CoA/acyl-ACP dehydrogenase [Chloroflexi bacterium]|nr:acyl-CoA/acyl-ACP dehydrogenase [Chloroflexota bacterium]